jgi:hypothetical protein
LIVDPNVETAGSDLRDIVPGGAKTSLLEKADCLFERDVALRDYHPWKHQHRAKGKGRNELQETSC